VPSGARRVSVDAGFPFRADQRFWTASFRTTLTGNTISGSKQAPVLITFTRNSTAIFAGELKKNFKYLQGSTITVSDPGADLNGYWFDHPATDPIDRRFLNNLPDYWMDRYEVTNRAFNLFLDAGGYRKPEYWKQPFAEDGKMLSWEEAMSRFRDKAGRPGPTTWELGNYPEGQGDYPVTGVSWYQAKQVLRAPPTLFPLAKKQQEAS
jgi:hypothetical protein